MKTIITVTFLFTFFSGYSQKIPLDSLTQAPIKYCFEYDAGGNMVRRYICQDTLMEIKQRNDNINASKSLASNNILLDLGGSILCYPIPTKNIFYIEISKNEIISEIKSIVLFDNNGKELISRKIISSLNQFDLGQFENGFVFIKISYEDQEVMYKIVKQD